MLLKIAAIKTKEKVVRTPVDASRMKVGAQWLRFCVAVRVCPAPQTGSAVRRAHARPGEA